MHINGNSPDSDPVGQSGAPAPDPANARLEKRLREAYYDLWDSFVDPREAFWDNDGGWLPLGGAAGAGPFARPAIVNEQQLRELRAECRVLAASNEFAINGHENRISYLVGSGHTYRAEIRKGSGADATLAGQVQGVLDAFVRENKWQRRQQEIVRRLDRDGEAFLRYFVDRDGCTRVRFVEPDQIVTPSARVGDPAASFGVLTDTEDVETVLSYYVDGQAVDAAEIQHRKANVDGNVKRGLPLFFPVRKNLRRAEKLLRNMSVVAEIQSAIALIRKHQGGIRSGVQQFAASQTDVTLTQAATGRTTSFRRFGPGTILDAPGGIEYDFPAAGLDAANFVAVLQAELRAIASRLVMPEFMLTSDASNGNYASTMVAEGPAMRMFARLQADMVNDDLEVLWRVVQAAIDAGCLPAAALSEIEIQASPPSLATRDQKQEAEVHQIEYQNGILSPQTWCRRRGLDYDQEQANLAQHNQRPQEVAGAELLAPTVRAIEGAYAPDAPREQELLEFVRAIMEGGWDPAKHPRGGNPQNPGEFSSAGGGGGGGAAAPGQPANSQAGIASGSSIPSTVQPALKTSPHVILVAQKTEKKPAENDIHGRGEWSFDSDEKFYDHALQLLPDDDDRPADWKGKAALGCIGLNSLRVGDERKPSAAPIQNVLTRPKAQIFVSEDAAKEYMKKQPADADEPYILTAVQFDFNPDKNLLQDPKDRFSKLDPDKPHELREFNNVWDTKAIGNFNFATRLDDYWEYMNHGLSVKTTPVKLIHAEHLPGTFQGTVYVVVKKIKWPTSR